jgi:thiol-disulfide isomerase/thioredoxin
LQHGSDHGIVDISRQGGGERLGIRGVRELAVSLFLQVDEIQRRAGGIDRSTADTCGLSRPHGALNLWATSCVPCRKEMPSLDRLQAKLGGADFRVLPLSIDFRGRDAVALLSRAC